MRTELDLTVPDFLQRTTEEKMNSLKRIHAITNDFAASDWLKAAVLTILERDCVDAARDAEILAEIARARANEIASYHLEAGHLTPGEEVS